jgi:hypothetical protein
MGFWCGQNVLCASLPEQQPTVSAKFGDYPVGPIRRNCAQANLGVFYCCATGLRAVAFLIIYILHCFAVL